MPVVQPKKKSSNQHLALVVCGDAGTATEPATGSPRRNVSRSKTSSRAPSRQTLRATRVRQIAELSADARALRHQVLRAALASGYPISPDAVTAILGAKAQKRGPLRYFTEDSVWDLVWFDISHWCGCRGLELPGGLHRALWFVLGYLDQVNELHPHSDPVEDLRAPLLSSAGLGPDGTPRFGF